MFTINGKKAIYDSSVFNVLSFEHAKSVVLGFLDSGSEDRWSKETPYLVSLILGQHALDQNSIVVDYGCGVGRIAKELIASTGCFVVGVDISPSMRLLSTVYVDDDRFVACSPKALRLLSIAADLVVSIWVLQHVKDLVADVSIIESLIKPKGRLFLVNNEKRAVPMNVEGEFAWGDDRKDIRSVISNYRLKEVSSGKLPDSVATETLSRGTFWASYQRTVDLR